MSQVAPAKQKSVHNSALSSLFSATVLAALCLLASSPLLHAQAQTTADGKFTVAVPPGWQPVAQPSTEFAYQFPGPDPLIFFVISERKPLREVFNDIRKEANDPKIQDFATGTGWKGTKVTVRRSLSTPGTYIFQYYYLFHRNRYTYALVFTTGICQEDQTPEPMFDAIARTVHSK
jgi:hypothetical protein